MTQVLKVPAKVVKKVGSDIKTTIKSAVEPATPQGTSQVFLGALLGAPVGSVYNAVYNGIMGKMAIPPLFNMIVRVIAPLIPIFLVKKLKLPFGNIINGVLAGVSLATILNIVFGALGGKGFGEIPITSPSDPLEIDTLYDSWIGSLL